MVYKKLLTGIEKYGSDKKDICRQFIGVDICKISESVIIAPWWEPKVFDPFWTDIKYICESEFASIKVWSMIVNNKGVTYIRTGIGAPVLTDVVLALGITNCHKLLFVGSVGSLDEKIGIGDIVIPEYSISGDGVSRYLKRNRLKENDVFGEKVFSDKVLFTELCRITESVATNNGIKYHIGSAFSIDTIFSQFAYIDEILEMGCNVIEMETAAAFRAAEIAGISMAAIFSVSDNTITKKSLLSGRTQEEMDYRRKVRKGIIPKIISEII